MKNTPEIPHLPSGELYHAVSSLANSAVLYRKVFLLLADKNSQIDVHTLLIENEQTLRLADEVITAWEEEMGLSEAEFDIEKAIEKKGFYLDFEKDERSTYLKGNLSITLHWDGTMIDEEGYNVSLTIKDLGDRGIIYFGRRPTMQKELDSLFDLLKITDYQ